MLDSVEVELLCKIIHMHTVINKGYFYHIFSFIIAPSFDGWSTELGTFGIF